MTLPKSNIPQHQFSRNVTGTRNEGGEEEEYDALGTRNRTLISEPKAKSAPNASTPLIEAHVEFSLTRTEKKGGYIIRTGIEEWERRKRAHRAR